MSADVRTLLVLAPWLWACGGEDVPRAPTVADDVTEPVTDPVDAGATDAPQPLTFTEDVDADFPNPERGWVGHGTPYAEARAAGYTVVWTDGYEGSVYRLDDYREAALPQARLDAVAADLALARQHGIKLKVRFFYTGNPDYTAPDASVERILGHIDQLMPILAANADVVAVLDAGFFGRWGENDTSSYGISDRSPEGEQKRAEIFGALLEGLPPSRMIGLRYPVHVRELFGEEPMAVEERFSGSQRSRVGWLNDCFLADKTNVGTYDYWSGEAAGDLDRATFAALGTYAVGSGETCDLYGLNAYNTCEASLAEMEVMGGPDLLNRDFWAEMYDRWAFDGCYDEITRRLGYRLVLVSGEAPTAVAPGGSMTLKLQIRNAGFGKVYNPRPVDVVFVGPGGPFTARLSDDARTDLPTGGETADVEWQAEAPAALRQGESYELRLRLPDPEASLAADQRYAIRFANLGTWDEGEGTNSLGARVTVE